MFLILVKYKKPIDVVDRYLLEHRNFLEEGYKNNLFIASGPQNPRVGGVILSQLKNKNQVVNLMKQDPFSVNDVADFEIIEFDPVKFHPKFEPFL